jgi:hypothetical protein
MFAPARLRYDRNRCGIRYGIQNAAEKRLCEQQDYVDSFCDYEGIYGRNWNAQKIAWCRAEKKKIEEEKLRLMVSRAYIKKDCGEEVEDDWLM